MLAQRDSAMYTPQPRPLATLRRDVAKKLELCGCEATRQRVLLAVNEIAANVLRHAVPRATDIHVEFIDHDEQFYCVIRDDGGAFVRFKHQWELAGMGSPERIFAEDHMGLKMIRRLWPEAFYIPRCEAFPYNSFILPLTQKGVVQMPPYFLPARPGKWWDSLAPLTKGHSA